MANLGFFNAAEVPPQQDYSPIPAGEYPAQIIDSNMKATASNNGQYLELTHQIIDGPYKGRNVWARLNLDNPNAQTVQIAQQQLSSICHAIGVLKPGDSTALHNKPMVIRVEFIAAGSVDKRGRTRDRDTNEIKAWKKLEGNAPAAPSAPAHAATSTSPPTALQAAAPAAASPPWQRSAAA